MIYGWKQWTLIEWEEEHFTIFFIKYHEKCLNLLESEFISEKFKNRIPKNKNWSSSWGPYYKHNSASSKGLHVHTHLLRRYVIFLVLISSWNVGQLSNFINETKQCKDGFTL